MIDDTTPLDRFMHQILMASSETPILVPDNHAMPHHPKSAPPKIPMSRKGDMQPTTRSVAVTFQEEDVGLLSQRLHVALRWTNGDARKPDHGMRPLRHLPSFDLLPGVPLEQSNPGA
jgi:hypothetical protein